MTPQLDQQKKQRMKGVLLYLAAYLTVFFLLERRHVVPYILHTSFDNLIPFCSAFIIPYISWYAYVAITVLFFTLFVDSESEFSRLATTFFIGNTLFLFISFVFPNGHLLRPTLIGHDLLTELVRLLYSIDTSTNILPSMHVFNAVACCIAIHHDETLRRKPYIVTCSNILTVLIVLSTMFLKQHTVLDVLLALILNCICYSFIYKSNHFDQLLKTGFKTKHFNRKRLN